MMIRSTFVKFVFAGCVALVVSGAAIGQTKDALAPQGRWTGAGPGAAATPPMGWSSWNAFHTDITEDRLMGAAQAIVDSGLARLGYVYINIDDGWWMKRRKGDGLLQVRTAIFPSAAVGGAEETSFRPLVDRLHGMGLKAGIYSDIGRNACSQAWNLNSPNLPVGDTAEREVGLYGNVDRDIRLYFSNWDFDYIKVDACGLADYGADRAHVKSQNYRPFEPIMRRGSSPAPTSRRSGRSIARSRTPCRVPGQPMTTSSRSATGARPMSGPGARKSATSGAPATTFSRTGRRCCTRSIRFRAAPSMPTPAPGTTLTCCTSARGISMQIT